MKQTAAERNWSRGYFCAVAILLKEHGMVTPEVDMLFKGDRGWQNADECDLETFCEHGLIEGVPGDYRKTYK